LLIAADVAALRYRNAVGSEEAPVILEVFPDRKAAFMYGAVMLGAKEQEILEARRTARGPVLYVMPVDEAPAVAAGKGAALVACPQSLADARQVWTKPSNHKQLNFNCSQAVVLASNHFGFWILDFGLSSL
jgi:hypothetical protein